MKKALRIAWLEFSTLFYSPIAWLLLIVLLVQCGLLYFPLLTQSVKLQEIGGHNLKYIANLTEQLYEPQQGLLFVILSKLYLYVPLLTMGLMSRETSSGTVKLLYSSPVKITEIVFGKFMAMMAYNLLMVLIFGIFVLTGIFVLKSPETGTLLAALLGIYLLLCTYSAIGLFMSCLTSYQVVAALSTFVVFAFLNYIGGVWQGIDFIRDLTYFLSVSGRVEKMLFGLVTTREILYFMLIIFMFLGFSICKLLDDRESYSWLYKSRRYIAIFICALTIGYISSRPGCIGYLDASTRKINTIAPHTRDIIKAMDSPLEITFYANLLDNYYYEASPVNRNQYLDRWEKYIRFKPDIKLKYVFYYDSVQNGNLYKQNPDKTLAQIARKTAKMNKISFDRFKSPAEIKKIIDLRGEKNRGVMQLRYKGKVTFLRFFDDATFFPSETEVCAALKRLMVNIPKIGFLQGQMERSITTFNERDYSGLINYKTFRYALVNQGFDVENVSLDNSDKVPSAITALVIADPQIPFSSAVTAKINNYIALGGNVLIAGEPGKQAILNPVLQPLGVKLMDGELVQQSKDFAPDLVLPYLTKTAVSLSKILKSDFEDSVRTSMPGLAGLSYGGNSSFTVQPILMTDSRFSWNKKTKLVADSADVVYHPQDGDEKMSVPAALALTRNINGKQQRIIVTGDADFMSNGELSRNNVFTANFGLGLSIFGWFSNGQFPVDTTFPKAKDTAVYLTSAGLGHLKVLFVWILPGLILISGTIFLIRRKRQ